MRQRHAPHVGAAAYLLLPHDTFVSRATKIEQLFFIKSNFFCKFASETCPWQTENQSQAINNKQHYQ